MTDVMSSPGVVASPAAAVDPRVAWANEMRKVVTRADALNEDGSLNQQFFKPKKVVFATEKAKWSDNDWENLYKGIEKFGIDPSSWKKIIEEFCPGRDVLFIRIKASRAIGSQGLNRYHGWIGNKVGGREVAFMFASARSHFARVALSLFSSRLFPRRQSP